MTHACIREYSSFNRNEPSTFCVNSVRMSGSEEVILITQQFLYSSESLILTHYCGIVCHSVRPDFWTDFLVSSQALATSVKKRPLLRGEDIIRDLDAWRILY